MNPHNNRQYIRLSPDLDILYDHSDGYSCSPYGDEVSNDDPMQGPVFRIIVPGIHEWVRRYEDATDFADTMTDSSFDWKSWHFEGLQFAKAIWEQLPRCYTLYYQPPYEDMSGTLQECRIDHTVDALIESLGPKSSFRKLPVALRDDVNFSAARRKDCVSVHLKLGGSCYDFTIPFNKLEATRKWLEDLVYCIWRPDKPIQVLHLPDCYLTFYTQTIGVHREMGRFEICKEFVEFPEFTAYVNTVLFLKGFYLSVMNALGFNIYPLSLANGDDYPSGDERVKLWQPYNTFKSPKVEHNISDILSSQFTDPNKEPISETLVMFPDFGDCIFWDTMGIGCGDYKEINAESGDIKLNVPDLKDWAEEMCNPKKDTCFEYLWEKGWQLALRVRDQLPDNIDLYYMCYDPAHPRSRIGYDCSLPKIIVPRVWNVYDPY